MEADDTLSQAFILRSSPLKYLPAFQRSGGRRSMAVIATVLPVYEKRALTFAITQVPRYSVEEIRIYLYSSDY